MRIMLKDVRLSFPAIFSPAAIGDGEPAYGCKLIIPPNHPQIKELDLAVETVAKEKWKDKAKQVLDILAEEKRIAFVKGPYKNKKTGEVYQGYEGMFHVSARNAKLRPTALAKDGSPTTEADGLIYNGCYVHGSLEFWAQDNEYGRRVNCNLRGVMFSRDGEAFGGASAASADEFASLTEGSDASDFV
jgi:hypothetical protein